MTASPEPGPQFFPPHPGTGFVSRTKLRTRFLLAMLVITSGLTAMALLVVRHSVRNHVREEIAQDLRNSVTTFQNFQHDREVMLSASAELVAYLPITRAIMTAHDPATIQDASKELWPLTKSDLLLLTDRNGGVVAFHTSQGFSREAAQKYFDRALNEDGSSHWWFGAHHLYQTFVKPVYFGTKTEGPLLGFLVIGYEVDERLAREVSKVSSSEVAFFYGDEIVAMTLTSDQAQSPGLRELVAQLREGNGRDVELGKENFVATSIALSGRKETPVHLMVLGSYDRASAFLKKINRLLLLLGLAAVFVGSGLVFLVSYTFTRPLANLVKGVRALEHGDFHHPLDRRGSDEIAELTSAFDGMRANLLRIQHDLLESEQLATIGRMASSISHDLRHALAAVMANSEFLVDGNLTAMQREELYQEVRTGVNQMTDLIDSLLEFARTRESLKPIFADIVETVKRAVHSVRLQPRHQDAVIEIKDNSEGPVWFDPRKFERVLYNLLVNACEATQGNSGRIQVAVERSGSNFLISVSDNGPGIAESIRDTLFQPFVSFGKQNGTGLGLTVVQKIVNDHGGRVSAERSSDAQTIFRVTLPGPAAEDADTEINGEMSNGAVSTVKTIENSIRHSDE